MPLTPSTPSELANVVASLRNELVELRRSFHMHPELSGEESETAETIATYLAKVQIEVKRRVGGHGVVGILRSGTDGPVVGCRADMDALPIQDALEQPYRSLALGIKHACGHDVHMAVTLGTAHTLAKLRGEWRGTVVFLFQPAEESLDGARAMLKTNLLEQYPLEALLALHAFPLPSGTLGLNTGLCLAGMEEFRVRFYAPSGNLQHLVHQAIAKLEALSTASAPESYAELQTFLTRMETDPTLRQTTFLSCWADTEGSVSRDHLLGLVSIADFDLRPAVRARIRATLDRVVAAHGAAYDLVYTFSNPPLHNNPDLVARIRPALEETVGPDHVRRFQNPYPFAHEDFAHFAARVPAALFWLGTADHAGGVNSLLHTPEYDVDEAALTTGTLAMTAALLRLLTPSRNTPPRTLAEHRDSDTDRHAEP